MGKESSTHKVPINHLIQKFGKGENPILQRIFDEDYKQNHSKCYPLSADYVGNSTDCNAYVDVFTLAGCEWRQLMGKVVAYAHEIQETKSDKEIWLVSVDLYNEPGWLDYFRRIIQVVKNVMVPELRSRIHYKDFNSEVKKFKDISLDLSIKKQTAINPAPADE